MATVTRYCIMDASGLTMTVHGEFSYEDNGWLAYFRTEEEALEAAAELVGKLDGLTAERFETYRPFPDLDLSEAATERAAA